MMHRIREATGGDAGRIREVHLSAFPEDEGPIVAALAVNLLDEVSEPETISLVAEVDGTIRGHVAFSPVVIERRDQWQGFILAPLGVEAGFQKQGIGAALVDDGVRRLFAIGAGVVFVYGDPAYYGRFGFTPEHATHFVPSYELAYPHGWQAKLLDAGVVADSDLSLTCVTSLNDPQLW